MVIYTEYVFSETYSGKKEVNPWKDFLKEKKSLNYLINSMITINGCLPKKSSDLY